MSKLLGSIPFGVLPRKSLSIPGSALGRRLDGSDGCENVSVQLTEWLKSNPHGYVTNVLGASGKVDPAADPWRNLRQSECEDVVSVHINYCSRVAAR